MFFLAFWGTFEKRNKINPLNMIILMFPGDLYEEKERLAPVVCFFKISH